MDARRSMGAAEWGLLGGLSVLWGGSFFFSKLALAELPPLDVVFWRVALAALALWAVALAAGQRLPRSPRLWASFAVMGVLNNLIPYSLIFWGQTRISSGLASILNATTPLWAVLLAHLLTRDERLTAGRAAGVLVGLAGVALMVGPAALDGLGGDLPAQLAVIGAALSYAFAGIYGRRFRATPPLLTAAGQLTCSAALMLPIALLPGRPGLATPTPGTLAALLGLALLSTALAYVIYFRLLARAGATNLLLVTLLIPVSAILLGAAFLGELLEWRQLAGMALIGSGLAAIDGRLLRRRWLLAPLPRKEFER